MSEGKVLPRRLPSGDLPPVLVTPQSVDAAEGTVARLQRSSAFSDLSDEDALRVAQTSCAAKDVYDTTSQEDMDGAVRTAIANFGGPSQYQNRVRQLAEELQGKSPSDVAGALAGFAFCESLPE